MKTMNVAKKVLVGFALSFALLGMSKEASASGTLGTLGTSGAALDASALPAATRVALKSEIDKARVETPELFKSVAGIASHAREIDGGARVKSAPFTLYFKALGHRALFPMIEALVFDSHAAKDLPDTASSALRIGLIEAVGTIRDARAVPVLSKIFELSRDDKTTRVSAEGLSRIGTDEALQILMNAAIKARSDGSSDRERAVLSGMHDARRANAARFLAKRLEGAIDDATAKVVARSLGGVGNAWAWATLADQTEASATRAIAANALVDVYVRFGGEVREQAAKALLVVDDPSTPSLIALAKRRASGDLALALDRLDQRFANNPTH